MSGAEWPARLDLMALPRGHPGGHPAGMDERTSVIAMLNHTWFGRDLAPETQERLARLGSVVEIADDEVVLDEGEDAVEMGILISGRLALRTMVPERGPVTILSVEPGDIFGWSAVLPEAKAQSTVVATEPCLALVIDGARLRAALKDDHALAASLYPRVLQAVARRLRATRLQLLDLFAG
jgi:CRP-like cAMP-binding protein